MITVRIIPRPTLTIGQQPPQQGTGNVSSDGAVTPDRIAVFDGATGFKIKDGGKTIQEVISEAKVVESVNGQTGVVQLNASDVAAVPTAAVGQPNGVASLGADGRLLEDTISTIQALGSISGTVNINLSLGTLITATLTGTTTLTFTGLPTSGKELAFTLRFSGIEQINLPTGTKFANGEIPTPEGSLYELPCTIDNSGNLIVYGILNDIKTP